MSTSKKGPATLTPEQAALAVEIEQAMRTIRMNGWLRIEAMFEQALDGMARNPWIDPCLFLHEAKAMVMRERGEGVACPCCTQNAKIYPRTINRGMLIGLSELLRRYMQEHSWIYDRRFSDGCGDYGKLVHWDMIEYEERPESNEPRRAQQGVGVRPKWRAVQFLQGKIRVPRHALLYDSHFLGWKDQSDTIAVGDVKNFNWQEIMAGIKGAEDLPWP